MHTTEVRVRYAETDAMGIAHHSSYLLWFEVGRVELLRALGVPYTEFEARQIASPVVEAGLKWRVPARFDDLLQVTCTVTDLSPARVRFSYRVVRAADGELLCEGWTLHAFTGPSGRPVALPKVAPDLYQVLQAGVNRSRGEA
jgi:acyl-CoA thioester hydrolase